VLEFRILGPLEVLDEDRPVRLGGPKQRAALAILLLNANRVVSVERLADDLYAGAPPVTAVTQVQRQVSELRKLLGAETIETRSPGYVIHVEPGRLDLDRFERSTHDAVQAKERSDAAAAVGLLTEALGLWRGAPLADLAYESFAQTAIARLEELRLNAVEERLDSELELGRAGDVLGEIEALIWDHPFRERLRGQLMLALYRTGRQAEALAAYRKTRQALVDEFGIEPSPSLQELERRILAQDPSLQVARGGAPPAPKLERTILVVPAADGRLDDLLSVAAPLAALPDRALIVARLPGDEAELAPAVRLLQDRCASLAVVARIAAFTSHEPSRDVIRLAKSYEVELVVLDGGGEGVEGVVAHSPADVAVLWAVPTSWHAGEGIFIPFGGLANDWAAVELGAWLGAATGAPLRLIGTRADPARGRRDASRLLANASLAVQRVAGVVAEPQLVELDEGRLLDALDPATLVVMGFPARWPADGLGTTRSTLLDSRPFALVHRGTRPGGLAPRDSWTRFSWSLAPP
jgi:DNA-binding SARP family transcriptional activator